MNPPTTTLGEVMRLRADLAATRAAWEAATTSRRRIAHTPTCYGATLVDDGLCADCRATERKGVRPADLTRLVHCVYTDEGFAGHVASLTRKHGPSDGVGAALLDDLAGGRRERMTSCEADAMVTAMRAAIASESIDDYYRPHLESGLAELLGVLRRNRDAA
ncbi:hypothetical protein [Embleya hyalina]|uniref:Uncharacterized protein n=1 Tax=Embleya hyalina TaxID=516124 RepID=A0A401Z402_9ACTN|nr:hypothetical protein [Embleya hyalina]GCE01566.1 hypothetical protein EHYA_09332 [Embleya hyalina]